LVGLADRMHHLPRELSGGQIQRAAIARALFNRPNILLADEPTGNLDSANSDRIIDLFHQIRRKLGTTVVIVTHNPDIASAADREIRLKDGRIADA
jgi:ABC transporter, ATP-binding protein